MIHGHGGNIYALAETLGCDAGDIVDMSSNINPLGMPPGLLDALKAKLDTVGLLPEVDGRAIIRQMAGLLGVLPERMLAGNGTTQFIYNTIPALAANRVLIIGPTYADYGDACRMHGIEPEYYLLDPAADFQADAQALDAKIKPCDTVFICNPNNPTGGLIPGEVLPRLCRAHPHARFVIDESYLPFVNADKQGSMAGCGLDNVIVLWSASKIFGMPGLRVGFLIAPDPIRQRYEHFMQPWCVNSLAQAAIGFLCRHPASTQAFIRETTTFLEGERRLFRQRMATCPELTLYPSETSYVLMQLPPGRTAPDVCGRLARRRILIRDCGNFHGLSDRFIRVALKSADINRMAAGRLAEILN